MHSQRVEELMLQSHFSTDSFGRIKFKELIEEIHAFKAKSLFQFVKFNQRLLP